MCKPWKPGESMPAATVSTVTVAYPLVKSMVASATCLPSAVLSCVVSFPVLEDPGEVVDVDELLEAWFEQPFIAATGMTNKATAAATCFIINGAYPRDARHKREFAARTKSTDDRKDDRRPTRWRPLQIPSLNSTCLPRCRGERPAT